METLELSKGKYKIYHIPGKKIGCTKDIQKRVVEEQGYKQGEYEILFATDNIKEAAFAERQLQKDLGYRLDMQPYNELFKKPMSKKINVTDQTTTFAISKEDIDGSFLEGLEWDTPYDNISINSTDKIEWILDNVKPSMFNSNRSFVYNKAMHEAPPFEKLKDNSNSFFQRIRDWADERGIYDKGDSKTQFTKLIEESGELAQGILKSNKPEIKDAIGDMVVVLTNLAHLEGFTIEDCVDSAYNEISNRKGKMVNGTFVKNAG